jgi:hypothetical protein
LDFQKLRTAEETGMAIVFILDPGDDKPHHSRRQADDKPHHSRRQASRQSLLTFCVLFGPPEIL